MRVFHRTTPIRITLLILAVFVISKAAITNDMIYLTIGAFLITCREYIYNIEFYHGFLHFYKEKILKEKIEPIDDSNDAQGLI